MRLPEQLGALRERNFRLVFAGQAISELGDRLVPVALAFAVLEITDSASALGVVLAARTLPMVAFVLVGGVWADRLPRNVIMLSSDLVRAVVQATAAALIISGSAEIWHLAVLQAVYGTADAFFGPAVTGLVPQTVSAGRLHQANALLALSRSVAQVAGPALAGVLVVAVGPGSALAVDSASFLISAAFLVQIAIVARTQPDERGSFLNELGAGWRDFRTRDWLWGTVLAFGLLHLLGFAPLFVLGPVVANESLGGASAWATILTGAGLGAIVGSTLGLRFKPARPLMLGFALVLATFPALLALLAVGAPALVTAAAACAAQIVLSFFGAVWFTTLQEHVPKESISRLSSYDWLVTLAFMPVGLVLAGAAGAWLGAEPVLWGSAGLLAVTLLSVLALPGVRAMRRAEPEDETMPEGILGGPAS